jgi:hypothetical protein
VVGLTADTTGHKLLSKSNGNLQTVFYMAVGHNSSKACKEHGYKPLKVLLPHDWNQAETLSRIARALNNR